MLFKKIEKTHHIIYNCICCTLSENKKNLIIKPEPESNVIQHTIAYHKISENYRFDIITSPLDGKTLVIYDILKEKNC